QPGTSGDSGIKILSGYKIRGDSALAENSKRHSHESALQRAQEFCEGARDGFGGCNVRRDMEMERKRALLMGLMDGELSPEETSEIQEYLRRDQQLRDEYMDLVRAGDALQLLGETELDEQQLRKLWRTPLEIGLRRSSYLLIGAGF